LIWYRNIY